MKVTISLEVLKNLAVEKDYPTVLLEQETSVLRNLLDLDQDATVPHVPQADDHCHMVRHSVTIPCRTAPLTQTTTIFTIDRRSFTIL
jgi:hypothetical protein